MNCVLASEPPQVTAGEVVTYRRGRQDRETAICERAGTLRSPGLLFALIHRSAWNIDSANFALTEFSEVRQVFIVDSSRPASVWKP
jgi:hypothetical protein